MTFHTTNHSPLHPPKLNFLHEEPHMNIQYYLNNVINIKDNYNNKQAKQEQQEQQEQHQQTNKTNTN